MTKIWQNLLAAQTGQLLSYSEVARELGVAVNTVKRYVRFLELSYQGYLVPPLLPTVTARLVKSPKFYWTDVGLARLLAERPSLDDGPLFETAILGEILRWRSWQAEPPTLHFFRVHGGREVDFVLHTADRVLLLEVKAGMGSRSADVRGLAEAVESIRVPGVRPKARRLGLMATRGREVERLAPRVWAVPYWRLFGPSE